jgi:hypothetical protein
MAWVFLALLAVYFLGYLDNPYIGLVLFVAIPAAFVFGLLLIPIGVRRERRRAPGVVPDWPVLDLRDAHQRSVTIAVLTLTFVKRPDRLDCGIRGVHYMETTAFCGTLCHTTMEPEYVAHQRGPHAQIECVQCHVGPGAGPLVQSKLAGTRQLFEVVMNRVPRPVPPPPSSLVRRVPRARAVTGPSGSLAIEHGSFGNLAMTRRTPKATRRCNCTSAAEAVHAASAPVSTGT